MRRVLIVVLLVGLGAGAFIGASFGGAGHTATAGVAPAVVQRGPLIMPATPRLMSAPKPASRAHAPSATVPYGAPTTCFVGGVECSLTPCTELIGSSGVATAEAGVYVPAPATPAPTSDCRHHAGSPGRASTVPRSVTVTTTAARAMPAASPGSGASAASAAAESALPRLRQLLKRHPAISSARAPASRR